MFKKTNKKREGYFGEYGGRYCPEVFIDALDDLNETYHKVFKKNKNIQKEFVNHLNTYANRPSLLSYSENLTKLWAGPQIYLKREDLNHTGSHKINNALGQAFLAKLMGKNRVIAETGAGQHGVATATAAAYFGLDACIYMGTKDIERQQLNCFRMQLLGAKIIAVNSGTCTLKDATNEAMRDWSKSIEHTHYIIGSAIGPHPFPTIVRDFQSCIGKESRKQMRALHKKLPTSVIACVGGGSNAIGMFHAFLRDKSVDLYGIEAGGTDDDKGNNAASISFGDIGYFHGTKSLYIQDEVHSISSVHSISAGLDYPGVGPEHAYLSDLGRVQYKRVYDNEAMEAFEEVGRATGILPAVETAHAFAFAKKLAKDMKSTESILICLSGRGDKDVAFISNKKGFSINDITKSR